MKIFSRSHRLEGEIDDFMQKLSEASLVFKIAVELYLREGASSKFDERLEQTCDLESQNDVLRRSIERQLYQGTLIPESRGDVLGLLENLDKIHGKLEGALFALSIEKPVIDEQFHAEFNELVGYAVDCVDCLVNASRAFFVNPDAVADHLHKVMFFEKEADKVGTSLKRKIFASDMDLAHKAQIRNFAGHIDDVADGSEDVADRLSIYAIKRAM